MTEIVGSYLNDENVMITSFRIERFFSERSGTNTNRWLWLYIMKNTYLVDME